MVLGLQDDGASAEERREHWASENLPNDRPYKKAREDANAEKVYYRWPKWNRAHCKSVNYCSSSSLDQPFRSVIYLTQEELEGAIVSPDVSYLRWFMAQDENVTRDLVRMKVEGVCALDLQESLLFMQRTHRCMETLGGDGRRNHAVFAPVDKTKRLKLAYLVINKYALRNLRVAMLEYIPRNRLFIMTPVMLQMWSQVPVDRNQEVVRRHGMRAVMLFMGRFLYQSTRFLTNGLFPIDDPCFSVYENLPQLIALFHSDDATLESWIKNSINPPAQQEGMDPYHSFYDVLRSFLVMQEEHIIHRQFADELWRRFAHGKELGPLRTRYPIAWKIVIQLHNLQTANAGLVYMELGQVDTRKLDLNSWDPTPSTRWVHFYLWQLCFATDDMISPSLKKMLCMELRLKPDEPVSGFRGAFMRRIVKNYGPKLRRYEHTLIGPMDEKRSGQAFIKMVPADQDFRTAWTLDSLAHALKTMEYAADPDIHKRGHYREETALLRDPDTVNGGYAIDGPLYLAEPTSFAVKHVNLPILMGVCGGDVKLLYMEEVLHVAKSYINLDGEDEEDCLVNWDFMEAFKLVRAPEYYYYRRREKDTTSSESPKRRDASFTPLVFSGSSL